MLEGMDDKTTEEVAKPPRDPKKSKFWSMPNSKRGRPKVTVTASKAAAKRLYELSEDIGVSRGHIFDALMLHPGAEALLREKFNV